jgi:hypothetical protein
MVWREAREQRTDSAGQRASIAVEGADDGGRTQMRMLAIGRAWSEQNCWQRKRQR